MVSFRHPDAIGIATRTKLFTLAESLGGVESLIEVPQAMTHQSVEGSAAAIPWAGHNPDLHGLVGESGDLVAGFQRDVFPRLVSGRPLVEVEVGAVAALVEKGELDAGVAREQTQQLHTRVSGGAEDGDRNPRRRRSARFHDAHTMRAFHGRQLIPGARAVLARLRRAPLLRCPRTPVAARCRSRLPCLRSRPGGRSGGAERSKAALGRH